MSALQEDFLDQLEREVISFIYERYLGQTWSGRAIPKHLFRSFSAHARRLSDAFTLGRGDFQPGYFRLKEARSAYLLYFHLASVQRNWAVFDEITKHGIPPSGDLRVLDIGSGTGAGLWAAALAMEKWGLACSHVEAWDQEQGVLRDAADLWNRFRPKINIRLPSLTTQRRNLATPDRIESKQKLYDLILCSNVLGELDFLPRPRRTAMFCSWLRLLSPQGLFVLVEPALRSTSRSMMALRDDLMSKSEWATPFPCGHEGQCPLNREPHDWCHFEVRWTPPPYRKQIEKNLRHQSGHLKYSYLVMTPKTCEIRKESVRKAYRILSDPLSAPKGRRLLVCTPESKIALGVSKKNVKVKNILTNGRRGGLVQVDKKNWVNKKELKKDRYAIEVSIDENIPVKII